MSVETRQGRPSLTDEPRQLVPLQTVGATSVALEKIQARTDDAPISTVSAHLVICGLNRLLARMREPLVSMPGYIVLQMSSPLVTPVKSKSTWVRSSEVSAEDPITIACRVPQNVGERLREVAKSLGVPLRTLATYLMVREVNITTGTALPLPGGKTAAAVEAALSGRAEMQGALLAS